MAALSSTSARSLRALDATTPEGRTQDPEGVKRDILTVATTEFATNGFSGARVDEIAARTATSKRMIYYYFGNKKGLYLAVLEAAYARIRAVETSLNLAEIEPELAIKALVGYTFDHHTSHPDFIRLVMIENIHGAENLRASNIIETRNADIIKTLKDIIARGQRSGKFRADLDPIDLHMTMSALAFFHISNRATFSAIFKLDMASPQALAVRRAQVIDLVTRYVLV
jgi:AcrR family transcriptional regulator